MDDKTKQQVQQPVQPQPAGQPVVPVSGKKEAIASTPLTQEWVSPSTPEIVLPKEVKDAGVEVQTSLPQISDSDRQQGVKMGHQNIPAPTVAAESLGMATPKSVLQHLKKMHKSVKDSLSWLVRIILKEQEKKEDHTTSGYN